MEQFTPPKPYTLCSQCAQIFCSNYQSGDFGRTLTHDYKVEKRAEQKAEVLVHHESFAAFEKFARDGCHLCLLLWNQVPDHKRIVLRRSSAVGRIAIYLTDSQLDSSHQYDIILHYSYSPEDTREQGSMGFRMDLHMRSAPGALRTPG